MNFQLSAIGNNNEKNREHLEKVGYEIYSRNEIPKYLVTVPLKSLVFGGIKTEWAFETIDEEEKGFYKTSIDCTHSDELFRAVTAMRDDSIVNQWHTNGKGSWILVDFKGYDEKDFKKNVLKDYHKASLKELIEHFK